MMNSCNTSSAKTNNYNTNIIENYSFYNNYYNIQLKKHC